MHENGFKEQSSFFEKAISAQSFMGAEGSLPSLASLEQKGHSSQS
jgi:hypothetical protein